jgi:hypothetical protein
VNDALRVIGNVLIFLALAPTLAFVVLYHLRVDWRASEMGRHVMTFMALIAALLLVAVLRQFVGDSTWFQVVRMCVFAGLPYVLFQRLWLLLRAQAEVRRDREGGRA